MSLLLALTDVSAVSYTVLFSGGANSNSGSDVESPVVTFDIVAGQCIEWAAYAFDTNGTPVETIITISDTAGHTSADYITTRHTFQTRTGFDCGYCISQFTATGVQAKVTLTAGVGYPSLYIRVVDGVDSVTPFTTGESCFRLENSPVGSGTDNIATNLTPALAVDDCVLSGFVMDNDNTALAIPGTGFTGLSGVWDFGGGASPMRPEYRVLSGASGTQVQATATSGGGNESIGWIIIGHVLHLDTGVATLTGSIALIDGADVLSLSAASAIAAALTLTDGADVAAITSTAALAAGLALADESDTISLTGASVFGATITLIDDSDTFALSCVSQISASIALADGLDTLSAQASAAVSAALVLADGDDSILLVATINRVASIDLLDADDAIILTAQSLIGASLLLQDGDDSVNLDGAALIEALVAIVDEADAISVSGNAVVIVRVPTFQNVFPIPSEVRSFSVLDDTRHWIITNMNSPLKIRVKAPDAVLDYQFDWSVWMIEGDTITDFTATVSGLTLIDSDLTGAVVTVWLAGGTLDSTGYCDCTITTAGGRVDTRRIVLHIYNRLLTLP